MNVCRLAYDFPTRGELGYGLMPSLYNVSKELVKAGVNIFVICKIRPGLKDYEEIDGIKVYRVSWRAPFIRGYGYHQCLKMKELSREIDFDLVHGHNAESLLYAAVKSFFAKKKPYVVTVHGTLEEREHVPFKLAPRISLAERSNVVQFLGGISFCCHVANGVIAVSKRTAETLANAFRIPRRKIFVVHNGVDIDRFYPKRSSPIKAELGIEENARLILYVGHYKPGKGLKYLLAAAPRILKSFPNTKFLLVGSPIKPPAFDYVCERILRELTLQLRITDAVYFLRGVPHHRLLELYAASDVFVLPSLSEGFPKVVLEAMACGKPVIATNVGGVPEVIISGQSGIIVGPRDSQKLADAIIQVFSDSQLADKMGVQGRRIVEKYFTWEVTAKETIKVYEKILDSAH